jgi:hypothetical protein
MVLATAKIGVFRPILEHLLNPTLTDWHRAEQRGNQGLENLDARAGSRSPGPAFGSDA